MTLSEIKNRSLNGSTYLILSTLPLFNSFLIFRHGTQRNRKKIEKKAGKANPAVDEKKKKRGKRKESYAIYIYKVLKQVHPDTSISSKAMGIMNSFVNNIFERIATEASRLVHYSKKSTISSREIQTAIRLLMPVNWPNTP